MRPIITLLLLATLALPTHVVGNDKPVLLVSGSHEWTPYLIINPDTGKASGALHDVLLEACRAAGVECRFEDYPWKRALDYLEFGDIDIICGIYSNEKRRGQFIFSSPIYKDEVRVFASQPLIVNDISDLNGLRGDAQLGASYGDMVDSYIELNLDVARWPDMDQPMQRLVRDDVDYAICPNVNCMTIVQNLGLQDKVRALPYVLAVQEVYIAFSRHSKNQHLVPVISRELDRLIENGRADQLLKPYLQP